MVPLDFSYLVSIYSNFEKLTIFEIEKLLQNDVSAIGFRSYSVAGKLKSRRIDLRRSGGRFFRYNRRIIEKSATGHVQKWRQIRDPRGALAARKARVWSADSP